MKKFAEKTGGIVIMQRHLKRWWSVPSMWPICFAILFGQDIASIDMDRTFDLYNLLEALKASDQSTVPNPEVFAVLASMLQNGLRVIASDQSDPNSPPKERGSIASAQESEALQAPAAHRRSPSMSLRTEIAPLGED